MDQRANGASNRASVYCRGRSSSWAALLLPPLAMACADDGAAAVDSAPGEPVYVAFVGVVTPDGLNYYATTFAELDGSELSLDRAVEFAGDRARMYVGEDAVFVGQAEAATITRFDLSPLGELEEGARLSVGQLGASPGNVNVFVSPEQAYLVDQWGPTGLQLVEWDPKEMATIGTIDVAEVASDEYVDFDVQMALHWGDQIVIPYSMKTWDDYLVEPLATAIVLDPRNNQTQLIRADDCSYTTTASVSENGDLYLASSSWTYLFKQFDASLPDACAVRVRAGSLEVDAEGAIDLRRAAGDHDAGELAHAAPGQAYTLALYPDQAPAFDPEEPYAIFDSNAWKPWAFDSSGSEPGVELDFPFSASALGMLQIDGKPFRSVGVSDSLTEIYEVLPDGGSRKALSVPGIVYAVARLR